MALEPRTHSLRLFLHQVPQACPPLAHAQSEAAEAERLKGRFLGILDELHAERERAAILQASCGAAGAGLGRLGLRGCVGAGCWAALGGHLPSRRCKRAACLATPPCRSSPGLT